MNEKQLALTLVLTLAAAPALAQGAHERGGGSSSGSSGASDRHPGSSGGSSSPSFTPSDSSSGTSYTPSSSSSGSSSGSSSSSSSRRGSAAERRHPSPRGGGSSSGGGTWHGGRGGGYDNYWRYWPRNYNYGWYPYGGYYDGYYWGYYGWGSPYSWGAYPNMYGRESGSLRLQVEPDDAEVYVDGYYAGEVDDFNGLFQRLHVRPGRHELAFKRRGFRTHRVKVYVPVGSTLKIRHDLQPGQASDVTEAVVGSPEEMERAEKARPQPAWNEEDEEAIADEEPVATGRRPAEVSLTVKPEDAAVYVDGRFMGNGEDVDELQLAPGKHRVEVVRPGYATFEKDIEVTAGEQRDLKVELDKAGASL